MAVSGYSPNAFGGIMLPKAPRTYKVKFKLWGYIEVDAATVEGAEAQVADMSIPTLQKWATITDSEIDEPEEVW